MATRVLILRHGQSTWNAQRRWQGQADAPLSELGERQAFEAAQRLGTFDGIFSSDLQRAALTAQIIADQIAVGPVIGDERLRENGAGEWEGLTSEDINRDYPGYLDDHRRPPHFEDPDDVATRVTASITDIAKAFPDGEVLVVAHGGVVRRLRLANGADEAHVPNLGGSWFNVSSSGTITVGEAVDVLGDWDGERPNDDVDVTEDGDNEERV
jgi:broad specificity phosphatase PhoE